MLKEQEETKQTQQLRNPENAGMMSQCSSHLIHLHQGNFEAIFLVDKSAYGFCSFEVFNRDSSIRANIDLSFEQDKTEEGNQLNKSPDCHSREKRFPIDPKEVVIGEEVSLLHLFSQGGGVSIFPQLFCGVFS